LPLKKLTGCAFSLRVTGTRASSCHNPQHLKKCCGCAICADSFDKSFGHHHGPGLHASSDGIPVPGPSTDGGLGLNERLQGQHLPPAKAPQMVKVLTISGPPTSHPIVRDRRKDAMETGDDDLDHMTHDLELDHVANDLPHSRLTSDDHNLALEGNEMQEDFLHNSAIAPVSPGAGQGGVFTGRALGGKSEGAMEIDDGDLGNLVDGLTLYNIQNVTADDLGSRGQGLKLRVASPKKKKKRRGHKGGCNTIS